MQPPRILITKTTFIMSDLLRSFPNGACLLLAGLFLALGTAPAAAQTPSDGLLLRLQGSDLTAEEATAELTALEKTLDTPTPYTVAAIHPHNGRWSVTISQGTLAGDASLTSFFRDNAAELFVYNRVLNEDERKALRTYQTKHYSTTAASSSGLNQGIQVHGSWSIEVRDSDGELARRQSFQNELSAAGDQTLSFLLASDTTAGNMGVTVSGDPDICLNDGAGWTCFIQEVGVPVSDSLQQFSTLTKTVPTSGDNEDALVLDGSLTARQDGEVTDVGTRLHYCEPSTAPANCGESLVTSFTGKTLQNPISVEEGQHVNVEVVISFN